MCVCRTAQATAQREDANCGTDSHGNSGRHAQTKEWDILLLLLIVNLAFPLFLQKENSTTVLLKQCSNACLPGLLLICHNLSFLQPLTILHIPLLLAYLICLLQELISSEKTFSFAAAFPCWRTSVLRTSCKAFLRHKKHS